MTYVERYFELMEKVVNEADHLAQNPSSMRACNNYQRAVGEFAGLCMEILGKLMEENPEVLARLK